MGVSLHVVFSIPSEASAICNDVVVSACAIPKIEGVLGRMSPRPALFDSTDRVAT